MIERKPPPPQQRQGPTSRLAPLVDAALETPGEWVAEEMDSYRNVQTAVLRLVGQHYAEVAVRGDTLYLRIRDADDD